MAASGFPRKRKTAGKHPSEVAEADRDYYLERKYPSYGNLAPRDIASRSAKEACDDGRGVGPGGRGVYLDFEESIKRLSEDTIRERYGNLFEMYEKITDETATSGRCVSIPHRTMPWAVSGLTTT